MGVIFSEAGLCHDMFFRGSIRMLAVSAMKGCRVAKEYLISIIDDDLSLQTALVRLIRSLGYTARGFTSAEEFLASGVLPSSACVISDVHMPGMSGIDLKRYLNEAHCSVPMIMVTARTEPGLEAAAVECGAHCFLRKPLNTAALAECIEEAIKS